MLEHHLELLEGQNGELERELENFVSSDEAIKKRLRSKTPPKNYNNNNYHTMDQRHSPLRHSTAGVNSTINISYNQRHT